MNFKHGLYYFLLQSKNISKIFNKMSLKCLKSVNSVYWPVYGMTGIINMPVFSLKRQTNDPYVLEYLITTHMSGRAQFINSPR